MKAQVDAGFAEKLPFYGKWAFALAMYLLDFAMWSAGLKQEVNK